MNIASSSRASHGALRTRGTWRPAPRGTVKTSSSPVPAVGSRPPADGPRRATPASAAIRGRTSTATYASTTEISYPRGTRREPARQPAHPESLVAVFLLGGRNGAEPSRDEGGQQREAEVGEHLREVTTRHRVVDEWQGKGIDYHQRRVDRVPAGPRPQRPTGDAERRNT